MKNFCEIYFIKYISKIVDAIINLRLHKISASNLRDCNYNNVKI